MAKGNHQLLVDGVFDILEAFPDLEPQLKDLIAALVLRETTITEFESNVKSLCLAHIRKQTQAIKKGLKNDNLYKAYFDVARYMTDTSDAAEEWGVDEEILLFILERRPPPKDRTQLSVPIEVVKKRTFNDDYQPY